MKVVEVIRGERTNAEVVDEIVAFVKRTSHLPLICDDSPGFVVNHAGRGLSTEGLRIVQEGVATAVDVDRVMREYAGLPMGPFELFDLTGLDVSSRVLREIYEGFLHDPRYRPSPMVFRRFEAGLFGRKVGEGFYQYTNGKKIEPPESPVPDPQNAKIFFSGPESLKNAFASGLRGFSSEARSADVIIISPYGDDATTAALAGGYDPAKTIAVDALFPEKLAAGGRITLMPTPATAANVRDAAHAALADFGLRVTLIKDSPGFISQRVLANIVNTACEIAQQRIARPDDIDEGVMRGLGYPRGPLSMGDAIGPRRILHILERVHAITGDPRYRTSLWLQRRALLNMSLLTAE